MTHVVCARGALACAVVDREQLAGTGLPCGAARPHVTILAMAIAMIIPMIITMIVVMII